MSGCLNIMERRKRDEETLITKKLILKKGHEIKGNYKAQSSFLFLCNRKQIEGKTYMDFCDRKNYFHQEQWLYWV